MSNTAKANKQFDASRARIDPALEGTRLASFNRRCLAWGLDWALILLATRYLWVTVLLVVAMLWVFKLLGRNIRGFNIFLLRQLKRLDHKLEAFDIEEKVRFSMQQYTRWYIYLFITLLWLVSVVMAIEVILGTIIPEDYKLVMAGLKAEALTEPFDGIYEGFKLFSGAIGGAFYFSYFTWKWQGQTAGKRIAGIRAVKLNGSNFNLWDSIERVTGYTASASLFLMGFFQYFWNVNHQTTHDKIVETIVVEESSLPPKMKQAFRRYRKSKKAKATRQRHSAGVR